jgi:hypothetical protein
MPAIHPLSSLAPLPQFDLFSVPATQTTVERSYSTEHRPINVLDANSWIEFVVPTSVDEYVNLSETFLMLRVRLDLGKTSVAAADWAKIVPVQNLLHSIFEQVDLVIGDRQVTGSHQTYAYKSYFDTLFNYDKWSKTTFLHCQGWEDEKISSLALGSIARQKTFTPNPSGDQATGNTVTLMGKINLDFAQQMKPMLGGSTLRIRFTPNRQEFYLHSDATDLKPKFHFVDSCLYVNKYKVSADVVKAHAVALAKGPARYPLTRTEVKKFTVNANVMDAMIDNAITGQMPRRLFLVIVDNKGMNGDLKSYPYDFGNYDVNHMACYVNGEQYPMKAYQPNFKGGDITREYLGLFQTLNQYHSHPNLKITKDDFKTGGYTIFGIDLSADGSDGCGEGGHVDPIKYGSLRVELKFATALPKTVNVLMYCEFDNVIQVGADRNPIEFI